MEILKKLPSYPEATFVSESLGDLIRTEISAPGYTVDDIKIESRENGIVVIGTPNKSLGSGRLVRGFSNFLPIADYKKFERKDIKAAIYNGILTIDLPIKEEFRSVKITISEASPTTSD